MPHVLLIGAGFSRNWGGWLASEAFEYLLGSSEVGTDAELRRLLWAHQRKGGFEDALAELQQRVERDPHGPDKALLGKLEAAVLHMFGDMNTALAARDWEFTGDMRMQVGPFLAKFDAIFTLNQDVLLEHRYVPNVMAYGHPRVNSATLPGMRRIPSGDPMHHDSWAWSTWVPEGDVQFGAACQPIYKLHGSSNWYAADAGEPMLIIGGDKARNIRRNRVLSVYAEAFDDWLSRGTRLMVIGYGFRDDHINAALSRAAERGLQMFVIDPLGSNLADSLNATRQRAHISTSTPLEDRKRLAAAS
jgi:hypothetical protein